MGSPNSRVTLAGLVAPAAAALCAHERIRTLIADDSALFRRTAEMRLAKLPQVQMVGGVEGKRL
jgi:hypothetical protein